MTLILTLTNQPFKNQSQQSRFEFTGSGTIGRSSSCDWILHDPGRYISGKHAAISERNGLYYIMDTSTNGVHINSSDTPLGKGNSSEIKNGDQLQIGQFKIQASTENSATAVNHPAPQSANIINTPQESGNLGLMDILQGKAEEKPAGMPAPNQQTVTPFVKESSNLIPEDPAPLSSASSSASSEQAHTLEEHFAPPPVIPDNWDFFGDNDDESDGDIATPTTQVKPVIPEPATRPTVKAEAPNRKIQQQTQPVPGHSVSKTTSVSSTAEKPAQYTKTDQDLLKTLLGGLGILEQSLTASEASEFANTLSNVVRETVEGMVTTLRARTAIKSEFRMSMTTIKSQENNPLKFSINAHEAVRNMFFNQINNSYMPPVQSIREGFEDLQAHQLAMMAGMQAALKAILKQFEPAALIQQFEKNDGQKRLIPGSKKARHWESYIEHYKTIINHIEEDFQTQFGQAFTLVYEEQVAKMKTGK